LLQVIDILLTKALVRLSVNIVVLLSFCTNQFVISLVVSFLLQINYYNIGKYLLHFYMLRSIAAQQYEYILPLYTNVSLILYSYANL